MSTLQSLSDLDAPERAAPMTAPVSAPTTPTRRAFGSVAFVTLLFLVVYGGTNAIVTARGEFTSIGFEWERNIPYLWWMLVPYLSIEFFFLAAPFLCRSDAERRILVGRITLAIVASGIFFLAMPLELSFPKRHASHWFDFAIDQIDSIDPPHNLFPSLHVALAVAIGVHYVGWTRGWRRAAIVGWFMLIGVSTVLTHRHHVADLVGGAALGAVVVFLVRAPRADTEDASTAPEQARRGSAAPFLEARATTDVP